MLYGPERPGHLGRARYAPSGNARTGPHRRVLRAPARARGDGRARRFLDAY